MIRLASGEVSGYFGGEDSVKKERKEVRQKRIV